MNRTASIGAPGFPPRVSPGGRRVRLLAFLLLTAAVWLADAQASAAGRETLPVPAVTIYPGDTITAGMLVEQQFPHGTRHTYPVVTAPEALVGKTARRTLLRGKPIPAAAVAEPQLVARGALTQAVFEEGGLRMSTTVLALQAGSLGEMIQLRNVDSGQVVAGIVQANGSVKVGE
jgi:flagella basal body P-ring formation protein FlgA